MLWILPHVYYVLSKNVGTLAASRGVTVWHPNLNSDCWILWVLRLPLLPPQNKGAFASLRKVMLQQWVSLALHLGLDENRTKPTHQTPGLTRGFQI